MLSFIAALAVRLLLIYIVIKVVWSFVGKKFRISPQKKRPEKKTVERFNAGKNEVENADFTDVQ
jgi:hypothetical protein